MVDRAEHEIGGALQRRAFRGDAGRRARLAEKRPSACANLSRPSLRSVRNAVPGVTSLSPSFNPRRKGPRPLNSLPRHCVPIVDAMIGHAAQHGVADICGPAVLDVAADRIAAARIADQCHARRAGPALQFPDRLAELAALVFGRGAIFLRHGIVGARQRIGEIDREHAVARNPVGFHPPQCRDPERRVVAIAMHEQDRRNFGRRRGCGRCLRQGGPSRS